VKHVLEAFTTTLNELTPLLAKGIPRSNAMRTKKKMKLRGGAMRTKKK